MARACLVAGSVLREVLWVVLRPIAACDAAYQRFLPAAFKTKDCRRGVHRAASMEIALNSGDS
jgi:homoserine kinase